MDCIGWIVLAGLYRLDRIHIGLGFARRKWLLCAGWFATGCMGKMNWMGRWWYGGGMEGPTCQPPAAQLQLHHLHPQKELSTAQLQLHHLYPQKGVFYPHKISTEIQYYCTSCSSSHRFHHHTLVVVALIAHKHTLISLPPLDF